MISIEFPKPTDIKRTMFMAGRATLTGEKPRGLKNYAPEKITSSSELLDEKQKELRKQNYSRCGLKVKSMMQLNQVSIVGNVV